MRAYQMQTRRLSGLWVALACVIFIPAASSQEPSQKRVESAAQAQNKTDCEQERRTALKLIGEVEQLKRKVAELEKYHQADYLRELLIKEEQRAQTLQAQLRDTIDKEASLQKKIDQTDEQMRPENIESQLAAFGSVHPEEARESLRRRLNNEKLRAQAQLDLLRQDHSRTQTALADSDTSAQRLRLKIAEASRR